MPQTRQTRCWPPPREVISLSAAALRCFSDTGENSPPSVVGVFTRPRRESRTQRLLWPQTACYSRHLGSCVFMCNISNWELHCSRSRAFHDLLSVVLQSWNSNARNIISKQKQRNTELLPKTVSQCLQDFPVSVLLLTAYNADASDGYYT